MTPELLRNKLTYLFSESITYTRNNSAQRSMPYMWAFPGECSLLNVYARRLECLGASVWPRHSGRIHAGGIEQRRKGVPLAHVLRVVPVVVITGFADSRLRWEAVVAVTVVVGIVGPVVGAAVRDIVPVTLGTSLDNMTKRVVNMGKALACFIVKSDTFLSSLQISTLLVQCCSWIVC